MFRDYLHYHIKVRIFVKSFIKLCHLSSFIITVFESIHPFKNARKNIRLSKSSQSSTTGAQNHREENYHVSENYLINKIYILILIIFLGEKRSFEEND